MLLKRIKHFFLRCFNTAPAQPPITVLRPEFKHRQFFFLHIPKTAGTSFRLELEKHFDDRAIFPNQALRKEIGGYPPFTYINDLSGEQFSRFKLISGHYQYREAVSRFSEEPLILIMMREPLSRCISECMHILRHANHDMRAFLPNDPSLVDISKSNEVMHYLENVVSMMLLPELSEAKKLIENTAFIGIQERMRESSLLLGHTFGWQVEEISASNVSPQSQQNIKERLASNELQRFYEILETEYELYQFACEVFESRLNQAKITL